MMYRMGGCIGTIHPVGFVAIVMALSRLAAGAAPATAMEAALPSEFGVTRTAIVVEVVDGDTVVLDDRSEVRLVGMQAPKLALGRPDFVDWPLADAARAALEALALGEEVGLAFGDTAMDRHGRHLAQLVRQRDGLWLQGAMLAAGLARVYSFPDNRRAVDRLLAPERQARRQGIGIWSHPFYGVLDAAQPTDIEAGFHIVEGVVLSAAEVRDRFFLNFGSDWDLDFTVTVEPEDVRRFQRSDFDPLSLEGQRIRVRGWVRWFNGPLIEASHPEQIEVLEP